MANYVGWSKERGFYHTADGYYVRRQAYEAMASIVEELREELSRRTTDAGLLQARNQQLKQQVKKLEEELRQVRPAWD